MKNNYDVIIIGSGAAGFAAAERLFSLGIKDICILTENVNYGTSRNAGSDKQTYYKLDICSDCGDSVKKMAEDLFAGGSTDGDHALVMASESLTCFMHLNELGVSFPKDEYGRFAGYRTDHDMTQRATSAGPLTSKFMTTALEKKVKELGIEILDGHTAVKLITENGVCKGVTCLFENKIKNIFSGAVVMCTGAPAAIYSRSVFPECQRGATGIAVEAGAELANFQEWQYGIASVKFRWNLSGSYQQVVPKYYSVDENGNKNEFLTRHGNEAEMYSKVFLKGYQWPFDSEKAEGSSEIDLLVFEELKKGRRVFMDYRTDPAGFDFEKLSDEAKKYLSDADCLAPTPFERLKKLNPKAVKLYLDNGIDLEKEPLEIGVCAQHNNGGIKTDINGETSVKNLFAAGEAAGHFGIRRPGGSALNDTQTGAVRIARRLAQIKPKAEPAFAPAVTLPTLSEKSNLEEIKRFVSVGMSDCAGVYRDIDKIKEFLPKLEKLSSNFESSAAISSESEYGDYFTLCHTVISAAALCRTIIACAEAFGSRGGSICVKNGRPLGEDKEYRKFVTVTSAKDVSFIPVKPIPTEKTVFEKLLKNN